MAQEVPGRLRPWSFLTFQHYKGGRSSAKRSGRLYPRINPWYLLSEAESTSGHMVLSGVPRKKSPVAPPGIDPGTVRLVAQRLNHYATPGPFLKLFCYIILDISWHNRVRKPINFDIKKEIISKQESGKSVGDLNTAYGMAK